MSFQIGEPNCDKSTTNLLFLLKDWWGLGSKSKTPGVGLEMHTNCSISKLLHVLANTLDLFKAFRESCCFGKLLQIACKLGSCLCNAQSNAWNLVNFTVTVDTPSCSSMLLITNMSDKLPNRAHGFSLLRNSSHFNPLHCPSTL